MPTLPEQITSLVSDSNLDADLQGQLGAITNAGSLLKTLIDAPPSNIGDLISGVGSVALPEMRIPTDFQQGIGAIGDVIPQDLGSVTGGLGDILGNLQDLLDEDTLSSISSFIQCLQALKALIQVDLSSFDFGGDGSDEAAAPAVPTAGDAAGDAGSGAAADVAAGTGVAADAGGETDGTVAAERVQRLENLRSMSAVLDTFPDPLNAENAVRFIHTKLRGLPRDLINMRHVPLLDDINQLLETLISLAAMDGNALRGHIETSVTALSAYVEREGGSPLRQLVTTMESVAAQIDTLALGSETTELTAALDSVSTAVSSSDLSSIDSQLSSINTTLDILQPRLEQLIAAPLNGQTEQMKRQFNSLGRELELAMSRLLKLLRPSILLDFIAGAGQLLEQSVADIDLDEMSNELRRFFARIMELLEVLNSNSIKDAISSFAEELQGALDSLDSAMLEVAAQTSALFDGVDDALAQVDTAAVRTQVEQAISQFQQTLEQQVNELFSPVRDALSSAVDGIDSAVDAFDPAQVATVLQNLIDQLTAILEDPAVVDTMAEIRNAIDTATQQLQALSMSPVVDEVIGGIEEITETLRGIDSAELNAVTKGALKVAVGVLPDDLEEPRNYLVEQFQELVETGPKPLLIQARTPVESLTLSIRNLSPGELIGDQLSGPFLQLIAELEKFKPSTLLQPMDEALAGIKDQVRNQADLAQLLKPLEDAFDGMLTQFDQLQPQQLIAPIEDQITKSVDTLLEVLPEEVIFDVLDEIIGGIQQISAIVTEVKTILQKVRTMGDSLENAESELRNWLQPLLNQVDALPDVGSLQPQFDNLNAALDTLTADGLRSSLNAAREPLQDGLTALQPQQKLTALSAAYRAIDLSALQMLPDSPQKSALLATLERFNPLAPPFSRAYSGLQQLHDDLATAYQDFDHSLGHWQTRYFGPASVLTGLRMPSVTSADLKSLLSEGIEEHAVKPVARLLASMGAALRIFTAPLAELETLVNDVEAMLTEITDGPGSLGQIRDTLNAMIERVRNIDIQFLVDELNEVFEAVKSKLDDVSPRALRQALEQALDDTLDLLDVSQLLPQEEIGQIDETYAALIEKLKGIDPGKLVADIVQPLYDAKVLPLIDTFDLTEPIDLLIKRLEALDDELRSELTRTDSAYQTMLQAVPV